MAELHYITRGRRRPPPRHAPLEVKRGYFYSQRREDFFFEYVHELLDRSATARRPSPRAA